MGALVPDSSVCSPWDSYEFGPVCLQLTTTCHNSGRLGQVVLLVRPLSKPKLSPRSWAMLDWFMEGCMMLSDWPLGGRGGIWLPAPDKRKNKKHKKTMAQPENSN